MSQEVKSYEHAINFKFGDDTLNLIFAGDKTIDTRVYPLPQSMLNKTLLMIETPGANGNFKARGVGEIVFGDCKKYQDSISFYGDSEYHQIYKDGNSPWRWDSNGNKPKYGWIIVSVNQFETKYSLNKRVGVKFTKDVILQ